MQVGLECVQYRKQRFARGCCPKTQWLGRRRGADRGFWEDVVMTVAVAVDELSLEDEIVDAETDFVIIDAETDFVIIDAETAFVGAQAAYPLSSRHTGAVDGQILDTTQIFWGLHISIAVTSLQ